MIKITKLILMNIFLFCEQFLLCSSTKERNHDVEPVNKIKSHTESKIKLFIKRLFVCNKKKNESSFTLKLSKNNSNKYQKNNKMLYKNLKFSNENLGHEFKIKKQAKNLINKEIKLYSYAFNNIDQLIEKLEEEIDKISLKKCTLNIKCITFYLNKHYDEKRSPDSSFQNADTYNEDVIGEAYNYNKDFCDLYSNGFFKFAGLRVEPIYIPIVNDQNDLKFFNDLCNFFSKINTITGYIEYSIDNFNGNDSTCEKISYLNSQFHGYYIKKEDNCQKEEIEGMVVRIILTKYGVIFPAYNNTLCSKLVVNACKSFVNMFLYPDYSNELAGNFALSIINDTIVEINLYFKTRKLNRALNDHYLVLDKLDFIKHYEIKNFENDLINILKSNNEDCVNNSKIIEEIKNLNNILYKTYDPIRPLINIDCLKSFKNSENIEIPKNIEISISNLKNKKNVQNPDIINKADLATTSENSNKQNMEGLYQLSKTCASYTATNTESIYIDMNQARRKNPTLN